MKQLVVTGAGPIGLHAALRGIRDGFEVTVLEQGRVADAVQKWGHVRLFTPFEMNSSRVGREIVGRTHTLPSPEELLDGSEYVERYLRPLADSSELKPVIRTHTRLIAASRQHFGKMHRIGQPGRSESPFRLLVETFAGEDILACDMLLDCTGFCSRHRFIGAGGIPCPGEREHLQPDDYAIACTTSTAARTLVVGSGYSAATSVRNLIDSQSLVHWITRSGDTPVLPMAGDPLPERQRLTEFANGLKTRKSEDFEWLPGCSVQKIQREGSGLQVTIEGPDGRCDNRAFDRIVANPGFRPNPEPFAELQIHRCYASEGPIRLAAHLLGEVGSDCLSQTAPGAELLNNPEPHFFVLGAASYGRDSRFLLRNGLEQVEQLFDQISVAEEITG